MTLEIQPGIKPQIGDTLVVESPDAPPRTSPLVTLVVGPTTTQGTIARRHGSGVLTSGMEGRAYGYVDPARASQGYSQSAGRVWQFDLLGASGTTTPRLVEKALAESLAVLLQVAGSSPTSRHYVLARGWRPSMGAASAQGTYLLDDPGHSGVVRLNQNFLVKGVPKSFANKFFSARSCVPADSTRYMPRVGITGGVSVTLQGGGRLGITTPDGHVLYYDDGVGEYRGDIPNADAWPDYGSDLDDDDPTTADAPVDYVQLPEAAAGDYRVVINAPAPGAYGVGATAYNANGSGPRAYVKYLLTVGQAAGFVVHVVQGATPSVQIDTLGTAGVDNGIGGRGVDLLVRPNPNHGKLEMVAEMPVRGRLLIEIYDVAGRLVATPCNSVVPVGQHHFMWDASSGGAMSPRAGLYFVRMKTDERMVSRRCVVIR